MPPHTCRRCGLALPGPGPCPACEADIGSTTAVEPEPATEVAPAASAPSPSGGGGRDAPAPAPLAVDERYEIQATLGRGGMGIVYKVLDRELDEVIALKVLEPTFGATAYAAEQFKREIKIARRINHPNVARVFDLVVWRGRLAISQEYIEGQNLAQAIAAGPLAVERALRYLRYLCSALAYAHSLGVVHRDLKPANVLIDLDDRPRVLDFGLAFLAGHHALASEEYIMGSPWYMAPEQAFARDRVDRRSDLYSLGVMTFQLLTGQVPFSAPHSRDVIFAHQRQPPPRPRSLRPDLPPVLEEVILRLLEKDQDRRFNSADEVWARLEPLTLETRHPRGAVPPVKPPPRRGRVLHVDDDPEVRLWVRTVLETMGVAVTEAEDGFKGVEAALRESPQLILLDILMPTLDGREALRILKSNPKTAAIPVVMVTGLSDQEEALFSRESGATAFLNKPLQPGVLELVVERYLPEPPGP